MKAGSGSSWYMEYKNSCVCVCCAEVCVIKLKTLIIIDLYRQRGKAESQESMKLSEVVATLRISVGAPQMQVQRVAGERAEKCLWEEQSSAGQVHLARVAKDRCYTCDRTAAWG